MSGPPCNTWQGVRAEVLRRIHARDWPPGGDIPAETRLAAEFGCARATVNRALRALAEAGVLERRRKAGTRVALHPVSRATLDIPVIAQEIAARGLAHGYARLDRETARPPAAVAAVLGPAPALHVAALHTADGAPFVHEDRWISLQAVPAAADQGFERLSANEWLLANAPYTHGEITFAADAAAPAVAAALRCAPGSPVFVIARVTWDDDRALTRVRLSYAPGYCMRTTLGARGHGATG